MDLSLSTEIGEILDGELGSDATLNTAASGSSSIRVIFYNRYQASQLLDVPWDSTSPFADCKASDVANAVQDDTLTVEGTTYKINSIQPEDGGWTRLILYEVNT